MDTSKIILGSLLAAAATASHAQSADIKVIGKVTPAACIPVIAGGGVVDYGDIPASSLPLRDYKVLEEKELSFTLACAAPTRVGVKAIDNRAASLVPGIGENVGAGFSDAYNYGLGTVSGANVGGYVMRFKQGSFTGDGTVVRTIASPDDGASWLPTVSGGMSLGRTFILSWGAATGNVTPGAYRNLAGTFSVRAVLNQAAALPLSADVPLDGLATLELKYL